MEIHTNLYNRNWKTAGLRLHDLADQYLHLARIRPGVDDQWRGFAKAVRWWGDVFGEGQNNRPMDYKSEDWRQLYERLWDKVDRESQPFVQNESKP